jgi:hypothetical protein
VKRLISLDNPYVVPVFITGILLVGHLSFGILESLPKTLLAIAVAIAVELILGRLLLRKWLHPASAYITGISVGILVARPRSGRSRCAARSRSCRSTCCASAAGTSGTLPTSASARCCPSPATGREPQHPVGQLPVADARHLGARLADHLAPRRFHITATYVAAFLVLRGCEAR